MVKDAIKGNNFFNNKLITNKRNPFENDYSKNLQSFANNLTTYIENKTIDKPLVISLNAPYGCGKTTFIDMWGQQLINKNKLAIKFDAWEEDYSDNPLLSILGCLEQQIEYFLTSKEIAEKAFKTFKASAIKMAKNLIPAVSKVALSVAAAHIFPAVVGGAVDQITENLSDKDKTDSIKDEMDFYSETKQTISDFKNQLREIIKLRSDKENRTMFFFIDELDRCKPLFAFQLIEIVKHFFNIEGVCFILVSDITNIETVLKKVYGQEFNSKEYMERPIDKYISLPKPNKIAYIRNAICEFDYVNNIYDQDKNLMPALETICNFLFNFHLREIRKFLDDFSDFLALNARRETEVPTEFLPAIAYLIALKRQDFSIYKKYSENDDFTSDGQYINSIGKYTYLYWCIIFLTNTKNYENLCKVLKNLDEETNRINNKDNYSDQERQKLIFLMDVRKSLVNKIFNHGASLKGIPMENYVNYCQRVIYIINFMEHIE